MLTSRTPSPASLLFATSRLVREGQSESGDTEETSPREFLERLSVCRSGRHESPSATSMQFWLRSSFQVNARGNIENFISDFGVAVFRVDFTLRSAVEALSVRAEFQPTSRLRTGRPCEVQDPFYVILYLALQLSERNIVARSLGGTFITLWCSCNSNLRTKPFFS